MLGLGWFFLTLILQAQALETSYLRFKEPAGWQCEKQMREYMCRSIDPTQKKEAVLILKAKLSGREDNIDSFYESLRRPLAMENSSGKNSVSKVYSVNKVKIDHHTWVRALHYNSKIANYFTEYLVTLNGDLAIGLELTYHQKRYKHYQGTLNEFVKDLTLIENIATRQTSLSTRGPSLLPKPTLINPPTAIDEPAISTNMQWIIYIGIGLILIFAFLILRR